MNMCVPVLPVCDPWAHRCPQKSESGIRTPGITDRCEALTRRAGIQTPLEEEQVLFTHDPSLHFQQCYAVISIPEINHFMLFLWDGYINRIYWNSV